MFHSFDSSSIPAVEACLALACVMFMPKSTHAEKTVDQIFEAARASINAGAIAKSPQGWQCQGRAKQYGPETRFDFLYSSTGEFIFGVDGRLGSKTGFDGTTAWQVDISRTPYVLSHQDREAFTLAHWIWSGVWTLKQDDLDASLLEEKSTPDHIALSLKFRNGVLRSLVLIDRKTGLPKSIAVEGPVVRTWSFDDYRTVNGFVMAHHLTDQWSEEFSNEYWVESVSHAPIFVRNPYEPIFSSPTDTTFSKNSANVELRFAPTGHLLVHPKINGNDVGWFIFDTGAGYSVISKETADQLGIDSRGEIAISSIFGLEKQPFRLGSTFELGPVSIRDVTFIEMDLSPLKPHFEVPLVGIIGYDLLSRCVIELDLSEQSLSIHDPKSYSAENVQWQDLVLQMKIPSVQCKFEGNREGMFRIDTGASGGPWGAVAFHSPAIQEFNLVEGRDGEVMELPAIGKTHIGPLEWIDLAGHRFEDIQVAFVFAESGPLADPYTVGNIGRNLLEPFKLIFNYPQRKIALVK